jgi:hypothetical protein
MATEFRDRAMPAGSRVRSLVGVVAALAGDAEDAGKVVAQECTDGRQAGADDGDANLDLRP